MRMYLWTGMIQGQEFLPVYGHIPRGFDAQADLASVDVYNGDTDVIANVDLLSELTRQD
jgi:hypothetical protein